MRMDTLVSECLDLEGGDSTGSLWAEEERCDEVGFVPSQHSAVEVG